MKKAKKSDEIVSDSSVELTKTEEKDVESHTAQRSPVIFEIVRRSGEEELSRPALSLWFSGLAAGISMGLSLLAQSLLHAYLPAGNAFMLIEKLGYSVGFIVVILAHQQLFTENTLTAVVPFMAEIHFKNFLKVMRLWGIVLLANLVGTVIFSWFLTSRLAFAENIHSAIQDVCQSSIHFSSAEHLMRGTGAGFLIASLVWIIANIDGSKLAMIILITYLISLANFSHVVAGSAEAAYLVFNGTINLWQAVVEFFLPTLIGNIVGGTLLFALIAFGQIHHELRSEKRNP